MMWVFFESSVDPSYYCCLAQVFGTNPFCVSAPAALPSDRYLLDMSTSAVAVGKIEMQLRKGEPLPSRGWALGRDERQSRYWNKMSMPWSLKMKGQVA